MSARSAAVPSRVVLMCGPPGSGKSTYARGLEREGYLRLSIDEEAWARGHRRQPLPEDVAEGIERDLRARLRELIRQGRDVVVDFSFWRREARDRYKRLIEEAGGTWRLIYLKVPRQQLRERILRRNATEGPNSVPLDARTLRRYFEGFEVPLPEESPTVVEAPGDGAGLNAVP